MALELTQRAFQSSQGSNINPQIVLEIDGVETLYGAVTIKKIVKIGDFEIGQPGVYIGGQIEIANQENIISFQAGTSTEISQVLNIDKGTNESISSMQVALIDKSLLATKLITPGNMVPDILGRRAKIWLGFADTSWRDDYIIIFRGVIDSVDAKAGIVILNLGSSETKKRGAIFPKTTTKLTAGMTNVQTTASVESTTGFLSPYTGPSGSVDTSLKLYFRINDEIMRYEVVNPTSFGTITRGAFNTIPAIHNSGDTVDSFYVLEGNAVDLALKLLASGRNGPYAENVDCTNFVRISPTETVANSIFFQDFNLVQFHNVVVGDYITTTGASNGANNVTNKVITEVVQVTNGYYIVVDGVTFVEENGTAAVISFRSQYDVFGINGGVALYNDEIDIREHLSIRNKYLTSAEYRFYLKDTIENAQEFLASQIYNPLSMYPLPRKAQASVGLHTPPVPGVNIKTINDTNVIDANKITIKRSTSKNFYNTIIYRLEEDALEERFKLGDVKIDATSIAQIPIGNKPLVIDAKGLRDDLSGINLAQQASDRRLRKYKFGAEYIQNIEVNFKTGFDLEVGDKVILDLASLNVSDINSGTRSGEERLFQIDNKKLKINTGRISLDVVDTNFSLDSRYCNVGPASYVKTGVSQTEFVIDPSFNTTQYGTNEYKKWENFIGAFVRVRNDDFSVYGTSYIASITGNTITLTTNLGFVPSAGYILEFDDYDNQPSNVTLVYGFMSDGSNNFADGKIAYTMS